MKNSMDRFRHRRRSVFRRLLNYFLKGLLFVLPVAISVYVIYQTVVKIDSLIPINVPGLGFIIIIVGVTIIGYFGSGLLSKPLFDLFDDLMGRTPGLKLIYNSVKDLMEALVGDKRKFKEPVMVRMGDNGISRLGFVTHRDLMAIQVEGMVAVYFPQSYAFAGDLFLVPIGEVKVLEGKTGELMQFIISGGVTELE